MNMDPKKILTRAISGLVYCIIIIGCIFCGPYGVLSLGAILGILACLELARITHEINRRTIPVLLLDLAGIVFLCLGFLGYTVIIWLALMIARAVEELYIKSEQPLHDLANSYMSQIYIGIPMGIMVGIAWLLSPKILLAVFFFLWINDTGAYLVGSMMGRHKLFERISPKKTWEGFIGGLLICLGVAPLFYYFGNHFFGMDTLRANLGIWMGMAAIVSVFGTWGDLIESMIKRNLHIKDSGNLIPGHGGILDRIDSLLLALPSLAVYFAIIIYLA